MFKALTHDDVKRNTLYEIMEHHFTVERLLRYFLAS